MLDVLADFFWSLMEFAWTRRVILLIIVGVVTYFGFWSWGLLAVLGLMFGLPELIELILPGRSSRR